MVIIYLTRHTRASSRNKEPSTPILPYSEQGFPSRAITNSCRALLPHIFTLTFKRKTPRRFIFCGTFHRLTPPILVSLYGALFVWSPDFPPVITTRATTSDYLACHFYQRTNIYSRIRHLCKNVQCALKDYPKSDSRH